MTRKEYELATALQALLLAVASNANGKAKTADQIYSEAGYQAVAALVNNCSLETWHDEITL